MNYVICYVSTAQNQLEKEQVQSILNFSQHNNNKENITGILLYSQGNFFQVLEGEKEILLSMYNKIKADQRHFNLIKIFEKEIDSPQFDEYKVDFLAAEAQNHEVELHKYEEQLKSLNTSIQPSVKYILKQFADGIK